MASAVEMKIEATNLAFRLCRESGFDGPPYNPYSMAARNGIQVIEDENLEQEAARLDRGPPALISLNATHPPTRRCFWLAYNVLKQLLPFANHDEKNAHRAWMAGATELLMPEEMFREVGDLTDWDLFELRHSFALCSHEAVARRIIGLTNAVATVFDNGEITRRFASPGVELPEHPSRLELLAYAEATRHGPGSYELEESGQTCRSYFVRPFRSRWQRIIVLFLVGAPDTEASRH